VLTCCQVDCWSQWPLIGLSELGNPLTDFDNIWNKWLHGDATPYVITKLLVSLFVGHSDTCRSPAGLCQSLQQACFGMQWKRPKTEKRGRKEWKSAMWDEQCPFATNPGDTTELRLSKNCTWSVSTEISTSATVHAAKCTTNEARRRGDVVRQVEAVGVGRASTLNRSVGSPILMTLIVSSASTNRRVKVDVVVFSASSSSHQRYRRPRGVRRPEDIFTDCKLARPPARQGFNLRQLDIWRFSPISRSPDAVGSMSLAIGSADRDICDCDLLKNASVVLRGN